MRVQARRFVVAAIAASLALFAGAGSITPVSTGQWASTASLSQVRSGAASVLLPDGRILITGGSDASGNPLNTAELFNTDGTVAAAASMHTARAGHTATLLPTGDVLVAGGRSGGGFTNTAELYDPMRNAWTNAGSAMLDARASHTASLLTDGSAVIIAGGENSGGPVASVESYSLTGDSFSNQGTLATARTDAAAAVLGNGNVLIAGGNVSDGNGGLAPTASTEIYDASSASLAAGPTMSTPRANLSATALLDGRVLLAGGTGGSNDLASTEIVSSGGGGISAGAAMSAPRSAHAAFLLPHNNSVLLVGGTAAGQALASAELYVPWAGNSSATGAMSTARANPTGAPMQQDGLLLVASGDATQSAELYGFATVKTDASDYAPGTPVVITGTGWKPGETVTLTLTESPNLDTHPALSAVADASGKIYNDQFSPDSNDVNVRFYLVAAGSNAQAETTFTDRDQVNFQQMSVTDGSTTCTTGSCTSITAAPGDTLTVSAQIKNTATDSTTASMSATLTVPGGYSVSGSSTQTFNLAAGASTTRTWTVTAPSSDSSAANFTVAATTSTSNYSVLNSSRSISVTTRSTCTAPTITTQPSGATYTVGDPASLSVAASGTVSGYQWQKLDSATSTYQNLSGATAATYSIASVSTSDAGTYRVVVSGCSASVNSDPATLAVNKKTATVTITDPQPTYDGTAKSATVATTPSGLKTTVTYSQNGAPVASPTDAGTYDVSATIDDSNYSGSGTGTLTIKKATATVTITDPQPTYDGTAKSATVTTTPSGLKTTVTYSQNGAPVASPTNAGTYDVSATIDDSNYSGSGTGTLTIKKAAATVTITDPHPTYDGTAKSATVTTTPSGLTTNVTYTLNGSPVASPTNAGTYAVSATVSDNNYTGSATGTLTINKATPTVTVSFTPATLTYDGNTHAATVSVTGVGGTAIPSTDGTIALTYTYNGSPFAGTPTNAGGYTASASFTSTNNNYNNAGSTTPATLTINKATPLVTWATPADIVVGTPLGAAQLDAQATGVSGPLAGTYVYTPATGTVLGPGAAQTLAVSFTPADTLNYNSPISQSVKINVFYSTAACLGDLGHTILQPVNADGSSVFKQKSTVPAKFRVCDVNGNSVGAAGVVTSFRIVQTVSGTVSATVDEAVDSTTPDSAFRWDPTAQQWVFNISTRNQSANVTYYYLIGLNDGTTIPFHYGLK